MGEKLPKIEPGKYCNARTKGHRGYCRRPAGWGTWHPGRGRCKLHGGATPIKHGWYSKVSPSVGEMLRRGRLMREVGRLVTVDVALGRALLSLCDSVAAGRKKELVRCASEIADRVAEKSELCRRLREAGLLDLSADKAGMNPK